MKLISSLLFFLSIEMHNARPRNSPKVIRISLTTSHTKTTSANARSIIVEDLGKTVGHISIGWPFQDFKVVFDTGSTQMWVFSNKYDTCDPYSEIVFKKQKLLYNHESSSSFKPVTTPDKQPKPELLTYGIGWAFGFWADDVIVLDGIKIRKKFLEATKTTKRNAERESSGLMGMRYHPTGGNIVSIFCDRLQAEHKFSYYLPKVFWQKNLGKGELLLCGEDESKYIPGTMKYVNETEPGKWFIRLDSVAIVDQNSDEYQISSTDLALVDTGTNGIGGPAANLIKLFDFLRPMVLNRTIYQEVDCQYVQIFPNITFTIAGTKFTLTGFEYTMKLRNSCYVLINPQDGKHFWILGEPFFRKYYTVFDMKNHRIGIAEKNG